MKKYPSEFGSTMKSMAQSCKTQTLQSRMPMNFKMLLCMCCVWCATVSNQVHAQLADGKCRFLGNVIAGYSPSDFTTYWNQVTPENAGKWGSAEPTRDGMNWAGLDNAYSTAMTNEIPFKQHTFVWGQQQPGWISALTPEEQKAEVEEWIQSYCERFPATDFIDVVNEPLHALPDYMNALGGSGATGWDWVIWAFEKARAYCPNAKLILNDYNIVNNDAATNAYLVIINLLKSRNLIDGIGEQGHFLETTPLSTIIGNLNKLHATGLPIYISEYDINLADDTEQLNKYKEQFTSIWTHPGVQGVTLWGYKEGEIWRTNAYLVRSNATERPALAWLKTYIASANGGRFCLPVTDIESDASGLYLHPNPSTDGNFKLELDGGKYNINIFDIHGSSVKELEVSGEQSVEIQLSETSGIYIIQISNGQKTTFQRIIVN